jgi:hypothetical protein
MFKCNNKSIFLIICFLLVLISVMVIISYFQLIRNDFKRNLKQTYFSIKRNLSFDEFCGRFGEWESIDSNVFVKKTAIFYFVDLNFLRIHLLSRANRIYNFTISANIYDENNSKFKRFIVVKEIKTKLISTSSKYQYSVVNAKLLLKGLSFNDINTQFKIKIFDSISGNSTDSFLNVKVKHYNRKTFSSKKGSMVCAKCLHLKKSTDFESFKFWIELNKRSGHQKISICDHAIENEISFKDLFDKYKNFLELTQLKCLPNLQSNSKYINFTYLKRFSSLEYGDTGTYDVTKMELINRLVLNECYLEHIDEYKYIAVFDTDEIILPRKTSEFFTLSDQKEFINISKQPPIQSDCYRYKSKSVFEDYLNEIIRFTSVKDPRLPFYFKQAYFVDIQLVEQLFDQLHKIKLLKSNISYYLNYSVKVVDANRQKGPFVFSFEIRSLDDLNYGMKLLEIYNTLVKPLISNSSNDFKRLFSIIGELNDFALGKTVHDTRKTLDFDVHVAQSYFHFNGNTRLEDFKIFTAHTIDTFFSYNLGYVSHFRKQQYFLYKSVPISNLYFDLNYFYCYFLPIFNKI